MARSEAMIDDATNERWDLAALRQGMSICLVLAGPFRLIAAVINSESNGLNALLFFVYLGFFVIGAGCAAWVQRLGTPMSHAIVTALGSALVVEIVVAVIRIVRGTPILWGAVFFSFSLVLAAGLLGGVLGNRLQMSGMRPRQR